jgi:tetratricopeptide (TPR) repeat protein
MRTHLPLTAFTASPACGRVCAGRTGAARRGLPSVRALLPALLLAITCAASAEPFVPANDNEIVERLPTRLNAAERSNPRALRQALQNRPDELPLALQVARDAIDRARAGGDPRELGQAQAALSPWWAQADPPAPVRLLRAIVHQSRHEFDASLADLDALLAPSSAAELPLRAQAELTRATVLQVRGRLREAQAACERLAGRTYASLGEAVIVPAQVCIADLMSLQGRGSEAQQRVLLLQRSRPAASGGWVALVLAEMAVRRGDAQAAEQHFQQALKPQPDVYTLAAYADWLLDRGANAQAARLLAGRDAVDALLLRRAIALKRSGDPAAAGAAAALAERFAAARARGDGIHAREEARFALDVQPDPARALKLASTNWAAQKEPADALLLVQAARAAGTPQAAADVWRFVQETGWSDVRLGAPDPARTAAEGVQLRRGRPA